MSYEMVVETAFRSDAHLCPKCGERHLLPILAESDGVRFSTCENRHGWIYLETVTGPTTGAGEIVYFVERE